MTTKPASEETQLNTEDDIVFARGGFRPTLRTEQFYAFLRKLLPLYENSDRWAKHSLVKCIVQSYTQGRFLKKKGSGRYFLLPVHKVQEQIVLTFRAFRATSRTTSNTHTDNAKLDALLSPPTTERQKSKPSKENSQDTSTAGMPCPFKQGRSLPATLYERTMYSLSRFEKQHFASELYQYQIFVDRKNSDANDR